MPSDRIRRSAGRDRTFRIRHLDQFGTPESCVLCSAALGPDRGPFGSTHRRMTAGPSSVATGNQLELGLGVPRLAIEPEWKAQPRLWGHSLHPMCSYLASFPAALAHAFIARYSRPGDVVLDPFSGRGTAPLQAAAEGRIGVGNDLNPFAHLLTAAKVEPPTAAEARTRATALRLAWAGGAASWLELAAAIQAAPATGGPEPVPDRGRAGVPSADVRPGAVPARRARPGHAGRIGSSPRRSPGSSTARRRRTCRRSCRTRSAWRRATSATSRREPSSSSPERDAFDRLDAKLTRLYRDPLPRAAGIALLGDARDAGTRASAALRARGLPDRVRLVLTSPPYLRVVKYGYYNWLRTWFLGFDSKAIDATLDDAHHRAPYLEFLRDRAARPPPDADRRRDRGARDRRRGDRSRARLAGRARPRRAGLGVGRRAGGLPCSPASPTTTSTPTAR